MRKLLTGAAAAALLATLPAPANAVDIEGLTCGLTATYDEFVETDVYTGVLYGGPATGPATSSVRVDCSVQWHDPLHSGYDQAHVFGTGVGAAFAFEPSPLVSYYSPRYYPVYVCTAWTINGVKRYYDVPSQSFSSSSSARCAQAIVVDMDDVAGHPVVLHTSVPETAGGFS